MAADAFERAVRSGTVLPSRSVPSTSAADARAAQIRPRCVLPLPAGPLSASAGAGQSGQRSSQASASRLPAATTKSSRAKVGGGSARSSVSWFAMGPLKHDHLTLGSTEGARLEGWDSRWRWADIFAAIERALAIASDQVAHDYAGHRGERHRDQHADEAE